MANRKKTDDTSNLKSVVELINEKQEEQLSYEDQIIGLNKEIEKLCALVSKQHEELKQKNDLIKHLESMLHKGSTLIQTGPISKIVKPDEKQIAEIQLEKLKNKALNHELTLEEARKFEIFSKVKINLEERDKTLNVPFQQLPTDDETLLQIAGTVSKRLEPVESDE